MPEQNELLAWVEPRREHEYLAAFVGAAATNRVPAMHVCTSPEEARQWVENEAAAFGLPVEWLNAQPGR